MPRSHRICRGSAAVVVRAVLASAALAAPGNRTSGADEILHLGLRGIYFVPNEGQWSDAEVCYGLRSRGLDVAFRESSFTMHLRREEGASIANLVEAASDSLESPAEYESLTLGVTFPGSNPVPPQGAQPQTARFNYFIGGEGRGKASDVPSFGAVVYENLYDGVDLHVIGSDEGIFKYEFHVAPGVDWSQIRITYDGIESLCIDDSGDLHIATAFGTLADVAPVVWQDIEGERRPLEARFEVLDVRTYTVALLDAPDPTLPLVIDPDVEWMYFLGGSSVDTSFDVVIDHSEQAIIVVGATESLDFDGALNAMHGGIRDAFLASLSSEGELIWVTYLGGSDDEYGLGGGAVPDATGDIVVTGYTLSDDFDRHTNNYHGGGGDVFVSRVSSDGQVQWSTYLGGSAFDRGQDLVVSQDGDCFVTGDTGSMDFEYRNNSAHGGGFDGFVAKLNRLGAVQWMTYVGGPLGWDLPYGIVLDDNAHLLVVGTTESGDFVGRRNEYRGNWDGFLLRVSSNGVVDWMDYLGGVDYDGCWDVALDSRSRIVIVGLTYSAEFEGQVNSLHGEADAFVATFDSAGTPQWMTYLGGRDSETAKCVAAAGDGRTYVAGYTDSRDFEWRRNEYYGGRHDAFLSSVQPNGSVDWAVYLGGTGDERGEGIATNSSDGAYVSGYTDSADFIGHLNEIHSFRDSFLVAVGLADGLRLTSVATCPNGGPIEVSWSGATGGGNAALLYARDTGSFAIPTGFPCSGTVLGLGSSQIQVAFRGNSGPNGSRTLNANTGPNACGGYLQLLDLPTCGTSNTARIE